MPTIKEIAQTTGFRGAAGNRQAEAQRRTDLPVIDNSDPTSRRANISTSVDCFVAGEYVGAKGQRMQITQRYTIFVSYSQQTQAVTMQQVRTRIAQDFQTRFNQFNMTTVHVPDLFAPVRAPEPEAEQFYRGSEEWRLRIARSSFDIGTEREKASRNVTNIRRRYGL
jgi:hypothetical protein